jgi:hypothetical protein
MATPLFVSHHNKKSQALSLGCNTIAAAAILVPCLNGLEWVNI